MLTNETDRFAQLREPFPYADIQWRVGARTKDKTRGQALPYINARAVQSRLDDAVGPENWRVKFEAGPSGDGVMCTIGIYHDGRWIEKCDVAQQDHIKEDDRDPDKAREIAVKGAASDAFKRAAVMWGIGRYLYGYEAPWVALKNERYLEKTPALPADMLPASERGKASAPVRTAPRSLEPPQESAAPAATAAPAAAAEPQKAPAAATEPVIGSADDWNSLNEKQRNSVIILLGKIDSGSTLTQVHNYLTEGKGATWPKSIREALLAKLTQKLPTAA
jgi:hypothetical protein